MDPLVISALVVAVTLAWLFVTATGRDALASMLRRGAEPVTAIAGDASDPRSLHPYRVISWNDRRARVVLARTQSEAAATLGPADDVGTVECATPPFRVVRIRGAWYVAALPPSLRWLAGAPCEHGGVHPAPDPVALRTAREQRVARFAPDGPLERALADAALDAAARPALHRALLAARVHAVVHAESAQEPASVTYALVDRPGAKLFPVYSSPARAASIEGLALVEMPFAGLVKHIVGPRGLAIVVNPNTALPVEISEVEVQHLATLAGPDESGPGSGA